jgi:tripartite-type tricarboxylate transporter receptor subunit TctC
LLKQKTGIDITHIPYRGGAPRDSGPRRRSHLISFGGTNLIPPLAAAGKVSILAVVEDKRAGDWPDIPTIAETYPGVAIPITWYGVLAPAGTPKPVVEKLNNALADALRIPDVIAKLQQQGQVAVAEGRTRSRGEIRYGTLISVPGLGLAGCAASGHRLRHSGKGQRRITHQRIR